VVGISRNSEDEAVPGILNYCGRSLLQHALLSVVGLRRETEVATQAMETCISASDTPQFSPNFVLRTQTPVRPSTPTVPDNQTPLPQQTPAPTVPDNQTPLSADTSTNCARQSDAVTSADTSTNCARQSDAASPDTHTNCALTIRRCYPSRHQHRLPLLTDEFDIYP